MVDERIEGLFSMQRDATVGVGENKLVFLNPAAEGAFPHVTVGDAASCLLPSEALEMEEAHFSAGITVNERPYTVLCARFGDMRVYTFIPQEAEVSQQDGQLLERVSGTMRRTLTVLNMATELLAPVMEQLEEPKQKQSLTVINKSYYQLQRLCDNLDHFFRLSEGQARLFVEQLDLVAFCRDLIQTVAHFAERLSIGVHFQSDEEKLNAHIDRQKMTKLLLSLISNSLKHMKAGEGLSLHLGSQGEDAVLTLRDGGLGIEPSHLNQVFTQYQSARSGTDIRGGVGLGLNIAQEIARLHGGTLFVSSQEGKGTTVRLRVPLRQETDNGHLQETALPYDEGDDGMHLILTELSDILDDEVFWGRYY